MSAEMEPTTEAERRRAIIEIVESADGEDVGADGIADALLDQVDRWLPELAEARAAAVAPLEKAGQAMYDAIRPFWESVQQPTTSHEGGTLIEASSPVEHTPESALIAAMKAWDRALLAATPSVREPEGLDVERLRAFANWAAQLDDPDNPESRTVTLTRIAARAQEATFRLKRHPGAVAGEAGT